MKNVRPAAPDRAEQILLHISGPDRPGVTSTLASIVASEDGALLRSLGQSVVHGYLVLSALVEIPPRSDVLRQLLFAVGRLGLRLEVNALMEELAPAGNPTQTPPGLCITLMGELSDGRAMAELLSFLAAQGFNIREIRTLTEGSFAGIEFTCDLPRLSGGPGVRAAPAQLTESELTQLRARILDLARRLKVDLAVQPDDIYRRNKRLVCMDVDSTFIQMEVIDELARLAGCGEKVAQITERAMRGELDFSAALRERVALLRGLPMARARTLLENIPITPGAENLVRRLKALGFTVGLVSGGFDFFVDELKRRFQFDFAFANRLELRDDVITGEIHGSIVDADRKAQLLRDMAQVYRCRLEQTVGVGDGANDMLMLQTAGLGIAFCAKPKLEAVADLSLNQNRLDAVLMLMGLPLENAN